MVVRVHPELLAAQKIPSTLITKDVWQERFESIRAFERYFGRNGVDDLQVLLHVSRKEQMKRFLERLEEPDTSWKFSASDAKERAHWNEYMAAYEDAIRNPATKAAPWYVVPADNKWFTRVVVCAAKIETLGGLDLAYPRVDKAKGGAGGGAPDVAQGVSIRRGAGLRVSSPPRALRDRRRRQHRWSDGSSRCRNARAVRSASACL
jgi:hypothetical protein